MPKDAAIAYSLQQLLNAMPVASLYGALAFAYGLGFGLTRRADFTVGAVFAFAGQVFVLFVAFFYDRLWLTYPAALALGAIAAIFYGLGSAGLVARIMVPFGFWSANRIIIASLGILIVLMEAVRISAGSHEAWLSPFLASHIVVWNQPQFPVIVTVIKVVVTSACLAMIGIGAWVISRTRAGLYWRSVADDRLGAALCGIDAGRVARLSGLATGLIVSVAAVLATGFYGTMDFGAGLIFGLKIVMIAAIGASLSPAKAALGAVAFGFFETLWSAWLPLAWRDLAVFGALVAFAVIRGRQTSLG